MATYVIEHSPSGDWAEAETLAAAKLAARTLLSDNDDEIARATITLHGSVVGMALASGGEVREVHLKEG